MVAGKRAIPAQPHRALPAPRVARRTERIDGADIKKLLNAPNFALLCRQKGVAVMSTTFGELEQAMKEVPYTELPDLPDGFFRDLFHRSGDAGDYRARLPAVFHSFVDEVWRDGPTMRRITEEDARKFFDKSNKPSLTADEIKARLPPEYRDLFEAFLPREADTLPPHRSCR